MSQYSPTVLPESYGTDWGPRIAQALLGLEERKRQDGLDKEAQLDREIRRQAAGVRTGTAPTESPTTVTVADVPTFAAPDPAALGRVLSGGGMVEQNGITGLPPGSGHVFGDGSDLGRPDFRPPASGDLAAALREPSRSMPQPAPQGALAAPAAVHGQSQMFSGPLAGQGDEQDQMPLRNRAQTHPGAFDPESRTFGGSPLQQAMAAQHAGVTPSPIASPGRTVTLPNSNPRYRQLDEGHYVDENATPAAQREREMRAQVEFERALRGEDRLDAASAAGLDRQRKMQEYVAAGISPARAALYAENPALAANDPLLAKAAAPLLGSPEYLKAQTDLERVKARFRPAPQEPLVKIEDPVTGEVSYVPRSQAIGKQAPKTGTGGRSAASIQKALANNQQQLFVIDDALKELDAHPSAVGMARGIPLLGDALNQRIDKGGVAARASIANIGSLQIHDRTGAAMTVHEEPRLAPFVPKVSDTPETIRIKLHKLRQAIAVETQALQQGPSAPSAPGGGGRRAGALPADPFADLVPTGTKPPELE